MVLETSSHYRVRLLEYEAEINLLAMMVLPLAFLAVSTAVWGFGGSAARFPRSVAEFAVPGVVFVITILLLLRLHPLRREEAEWWFRFFLMTAERPPNEPLQPTSGAGDQADSLAS